MEVALIDTSDNLRAESTSERRRKTISKGAKTELNVDCDWRHVRRNWSGTFAFDGLPQLRSTLILHFPFVLISGAHMPSLLSYN